MPSERFDRFWKRLDERIINRFVIWAMLNHPHGWVSNTVCWVDDAFSWITRVIYCHHNARVLADMEWRFSVVLSEVTRGMSKPYYTKEAMLAEIQAKWIEDYDEAYQEGFKDGKEQGRDEKELENSPEN